MEHTPGPWEIRFEQGEMPYIEAEQGKRWRNPTICQLYEDVTPEDSVTIGPWLKAFGSSTANAHLIAAAPDLLRNLQECASALADIINAAGNEQPYSPSELEELFANIRCRADETIAKAKNKEIETM